MGVSETGDQSLGVFWQLLRHYRADTAKWVGDLDEEHRSMGEGSNQTYRDRESVGAYDGDPFVGVPVEREVVEKSAEKYDLSSDILARALRDVEQTPELIDVNLFFSGYDPVPVGADGDGHLYLIADAAECWDVVASRLGLTTAGRDAVAVAHDEHVHANGDGHDLGEGVGFVVTCPEFPPSVISNVHTLLRRTALSARQATVRVLHQHALNESAIANVLSIADTLVESELAAIDRETHRVTMAARVLDFPGNSLSLREPDPTSNEWMGLDWSPWFDLENRDGLLERLPEEPGVYRVRHSDSHRLLYIGETGAEGGVRDRVGHGLASGLDADTAPAGGNHDATEPLWEVTNTVGGSIEVSVACPPIAANKRHRLCLEAALVAISRRETGRTPDVMLNRNPISREKGITDKLLGKLGSTSTDELLSPPNWRAWQSVTSPKWMGFNWTKPRPLADRDEVDPKKTCLFRVWEPQPDESDLERVLLTVGTAETPIGRLFALQNEYGRDAIFSLAELAKLSDDDLSRWRQLQEARYDLVGAHYLATGEPPRDQY